MELSQTSKSQNIMKEIFNHIVKSVEHTPQLTPADLRLQVSLALAITAIIVLLEWVY